VEYDLVFEPLQAMKGQVVADFLLYHGVKFAQGSYVIDILLWKLYFDGSVCSNGCGIGCVIVSPHGITESLSSRLEFECTNNQAEYEALWFELEYLVDMGVRNIDAFDDSMLVVQQVKGESQSLDGVLNSYRDSCLDVIKMLDTFGIYHIPWAENHETNALVQRASGYEIIKGLFNVREKPTMQFLCVGRNELARSTGIDMITLKADDARVSKC
jgi:ribonuclease HI